METWALLHKSRSLARSKCRAVPVLSTLIYINNNQQLSCLSKSTISVSRSPRGLYGCWRYGYTAEYLVLDATTKPEQELKIPYELHLFDRDLKTGLAPKELKDINPFGTAPYFRDTNVSPPIGLSESGAIVEYILSVYGSKESGSGAPRLVRTPDDKDYVDYLQWLHLANGTLQPAAGRVMTLTFAGMGQDNPIANLMNKKVGDHLQMVDDQLANNTYLAGEQLSAADIMTVFTLTTMRGFCPMVELGPYPNILRYLKTVAERPAYQETLKKAERGNAPMNTPKVKGFAQFEAFGPVLGKYQTLE